MGHTYFRGHFAKHSPRSDFYEGVSDSSIMHVYWTILGGIYQKAPPKSTVASVSRTVCKLIQHSSKGV